MFLMMYINKTKNIIMWTVSHTGFSNTIELVCVVLSVQTCVVLIDFVVLDVVVVVQSISGPEVASNGAQIKPGRRKTAVAKVLTRLLSSGRPRTVEMMSINMLVYVRKPKTTNSRMDIFNLEYSSNPA